MFGKEVFFYSTRSALSENNYIVTRQYFIATIAFKQINNTITLFTCKYNIHINGMQQNK